jgi:hypothetical protein
MKSCRHLRSHCFATPQTPLEHLDLSVDETIISTIIPFHLLDTFLDPRTMKGTLWRVNKSIRLGTDEMAWPKWEYVLHDLPWYKLWEHGIRSILHYNFGAPSPIESYFHYPHDMLNRVLLQGIDTRTSIHKFSHLHLVQFARVTWSHWYLSLISATTPLIDLGETW